MSGAQRPEFRDGLLHSGRNLAMTLCAAHGPASLSPEQREIAAGESAGIGGKEE